MCSLSLTWCAPLHSFKSQLKFLPFPHLTYWNHRYITPCMDGLYIYAEIFIIPHQSVISTIHTMVSFIKFYTHATSSNKLLQTRTNYNRTLYFNHLECSNTYRYHIPGQGQTFTLPMKSFLYQFYLQQLSSAPFHFYAHVQSVPRSLPA